MSETDDAPVNTGHDGRKPGLLAAFAGARPPAPAWFDATLRDTPRTAFAPRGGGLLHYLAWGDPAKPALLFVHGNGAHAWWWAFIAPFFAQDFHCLAMDLSGMGDSAWRARYSFADFAEDPVVVLDHAGAFTAARKPVIIAHSFGGAVTRITAVRHGARLGGVMIADTPLSPPKAEDGGPKEQAVRPHRIYPTVEAALERFRLAPSQPCENLYIVDYIARQSLKAVPGGVTWKFDPTVWTRFDREPVMGRLADAACRVAYLYGVRSRLVPPAEAAAVRDAVPPGTPVIELPEAAHHLMLDQPLAFVAALRAVLAQWRAAG